LAKLPKNCEKTKFLTNFSPFISSNEIEHHKSEIYAILFAVIYEQCTLPTVPAIKDDCIQQAVWRKLPPNFRSPEAATCAKPPLRCASAGESAADNEEKKDNITVRKGIK